MNNSYKTHRFPSLLRRLVLLSLLFCTVALSQGSDPKPQDATKAILAAFDKYQIVGMGASHGFKNLDEFILSLISNPAFPDKVNDIVAECGNRMYQDILDKYIAGGDVSATQVRLVWGNTTQQMCSLSWFYEQLFPLVRQINQKLPVQKRLRVVAADPPTDWSKIHDQDEYMSWRNQRSSSIRSAIATEVLDKKRKALLLFGEGHYWEYHETPPDGGAFIILTHHGFGTGNPLDVHNNKLETRMKYWPVLSLVPIKGTWLADLDLLYYSEFRTKSAATKEVTDWADAYLYLGPRDSLSWENTPADILDDKAYVDELNKRPWPFTPVDPGKKRDTNTPFYGPGSPWMSPSFRAPDNLVALTKFVGTYTSESEAIVIAIDIHQGKLVAKLPMSPKGMALTPVTDSRFRIEGASDATSLDFEVVSEKVNGVTLDQGEGKPKVKLRWNP